MLGLAGLGCAGSLFPFRTANRVETMRVTPLGDKVVVRRAEAETTTAGGIVLPSGAQEQPRQGRVLSVGDGVLLPCGKRAPNQVQEGDRVLFSSYAGSEVEIAGDTLLILREGDILAIVE